MSRSPSESRANPAHPRSRGEHRPPRWILCAWFGSSPLARGTYLQALSGKRGIRLIPARAGNIYQYGTLSTHHTAHPRSRGEHRAMLFTSAESGGSSPLARGTYDIRGPMRGPARLIPARAGNIYPFIELLGSVQAHPRSRGEHPAGWVSPVFADGSSPLARGTLEPYLRPGLRARLIPARAGNIAPPQHASALDSAHPRSRGEHSLPFK